MFRSAILHIGSEKTGTNAIQNLLASKRNEIGEFGFWYPSTPGEYSHTALAICCAPDNTLDQLSTLDVNVHGDGFDEGRFVKNLNDELAAVPPHVRTVIFSCEYCQSRLTTIEQVSKLRSLLVPYFETISVIVYLRRQDEMACSSYSTRLRSGDPGLDILPCISVSDQTQNHLAGPVWDWYFDFESLLERYSIVFGEQFVKPRIYEQQLLENGDVVSDFLTFCGLPARLANGSQTENSALPENGQRFIALLNAYHAELGCDADERFSEDIRNVCVHIVEKRLSGRPMLPSEDEAKHFYSQFVEMNERIRKKWFPARTVLFSGSFANYPVSIGDLENGQHEKALRASFVIIDELIQERAYLMWDRQRILFEIDASTPSLPAVRKERKVSLLSRLISAVRNSIEATFRSG